MENAKRQRLALVGGASLVLAFAMALMLPAPRPLFSGEAMLAAAREGLAVGGNDTTPDRTVSAVISALKRDFGAHIVTDEHWVFNNAGGAMGAMKVCSLSIAAVLAAVAAHHSSHLLDPNSNVFVTNRCSILV